MNCTDARTGEHRTVVVDVPPADGVVHSSLGDTSLALSTADVSRLRRVYLEAQAVALDDKGRF